MTAILISRQKSKNSDYIYVSADQRVTSGFTVTSENSIKIFTREATERRPYRRHYVRAGNLGQTDYIINHLEKFPSVDDIFTFAFEFEPFTKLTTDITFYIIDENPDGVQIIEFSKDEDSNTRERDTVNVMVYNIDEILHSPIFDGSAGDIVCSCYKALEQYGKFVSEEDRIRHSFKAAASVNTTINSNVTLIKIPVKRKRLSKDAVY